MASIVVGVGDSGVVPRAGEPQWCRDGRARNSRLRTVEVTRGPRSLGDAGVRGRNSPG